MASPIWGEPPKIRQEGASLVVHDHASWFTQDPGDEITRYVHVWYWNGGNVFGTPAPPQRSKPEDVQPGENMGRLPLGPKNVGGSFYVVEFGGFDGSEWDDGGWTEWGRENSATRISVPPRSNVVVVEPFDGQPPKDPPAATGPTLEQAKLSALEVLSEGYDAAVRRGKPVAELERTAVFQMIRLGQAPAALRDKLVAAMRKVS